VLEPAWKAGRDGVLGALAELGLTVFVKPARLGSSVGIAKVSEAGDLPGAVEAALAHDPRVIVEAMSGGLEVECSVMGHSEPVASRPGEIVLTSGAEWYDYEAKFEPGGMELRIPPGIPEEVAESVRTLAVETFVRSGCSGLARVDTFVEGDRVLLNELNTLPGFTETSVFGKLFAASGVPYGELLTQLAGFALERHAAEQAHSF
jgi:D-alanine-D-alanine ligase